MTKTAQMANFINFLSGPLKEEGKKKPLTKRKSERAQMEITQYTV